MGGGWAAVTWCCSPDPTFWGTLCMQISVQLPVTVYPCCWMVDKIQLFITGNDEMWYGLMKWVPWLLHLFVPTSYKWTPCILGPFLFTCMGRNWCVQFFPCDVITHAMNFIVDFDECRICYLGMYLNNLIVTMSTRSLYYFSLEASRSWTLQRNPPTQLPGRVKSHLSTLYNLFFFFVFAAAVGVNSFVTNCFT